MQEFLTMLGDQVGMPVIDQAEQEDQIRIPYRHHSSSSVKRIKDGQEKARQLRILLDHLAAQTELQFEIQQEPIQSWHLTEGGGT
jgi:hypothetical protein